MLLSRNFLQLETEPQEDVTVTKDQPTTGNKPGGQVSSVVYTYVCHLLSTQWSITQSHKNVSHINNAMLHSLGRLFLARCLCILFGLMVCIMVDVRFVCVPLIPLFVFPHSRLTHNLLEKHRWGLVVQFKRLHLCYNICFLGEPSYGIAWRFSGHRYHSLTSSQHSHCCRVPENTLK